MFVAIKNFIIRYRFLFLILAFGVLLLPSVDPTENTAPGIVFFLGRFHPLVIHFPVVLVLLALIFEILRWFRLLNVSSALVVLVLGLGLVGCLVSLSLGFLLYYTGEYSGDIMQNHLRGGVLLTASVAVAMFLLLTFKGLNYKSYYYGYISFLLAGNIILIYTSHQGGSLTHGKEYLIEYLPNFSQQEVDWEPKPLEEMLVYEDVIVSFLDRKCMSCHNENKAKGGLVMTSYEDLLKGGKGDHPAVVKDSSSRSDVYRRVVLPSHDEDVMPPEGKTPLTKDEASLLAWWIDHGADPDIKVTEAAQAPEIQPVIDVYLVELETQQRNRYLQKLSTENLIKTVSTGKNYELGIDPYDDKGITVSMTFPPAAFGDNDLVQIQPVFRNITKASFIGSDITDDGFYHLGQMTSLRELYLQQTQIKGEGLIHLSRLENLKLLNLSKTNISNGHLLHVLQFPALEELYLNETPISQEIIDALKENKPDLNIHLVRGGLF